MNIEPSNSHLGYFILHCALSTAESLAGQFNSLPDPQKDFDNTSCQLMRGLFGQIFTLLASGNKPLCHAFQLATNIAIDVPQDSELWIYVRLAKLFAYTCWPRGLFYGNMRMLVARLLRKRLADKLLTSMAQEFKVAAQNDTKAQENKNKELKFVRLAVEVFRYIQENGREKCKDLKEIAEKLLQKRPLEEKLSGGTKRLLHFFVKLTKGSLDWSKFDKHAQVALNVYSKRSAHFGKFKKQLKVSLSKNDQPKVGKLLEVFSSEKEKVKSKFTSLKDAQVRVQNAKSIEKKDSTALKGDAEIVRYPWHIRLQGKHT